MIRDAISPPEKDQRPILTDGRHLVDGINASFLSERAVLPTGLDGEYLVCAIADADDTDTLAGLAFASGRQIIPVIAKREAILATIAQSLLKPAAPAPRMARVRHAQAVVLLREHVTEAVRHRAEALRISTRVDGGVAIALCGDRTIELSRLSRHDVRALFGAVDALAAACEHGGGSFTMGIAGRLHSVTVEQEADGRIIRIDQGGVDPVP